MSVPKCKECKFYKWLQRIDYGKYKEHYCHFDFPDDSERISQGKLIKSKEMLTSPGWCPLRKNENYMSNLLKKYGRNK